MDAARRIAQLGDWLAPTDIAVLEFTTPDVRLRLDRDVAPATVAAPATGPVTARPAESAATAAAPVVKAHSVGVFLDTHPLATAPLVAVGTRVVIGRTIGLLRIGALLLPVAAPADAVVERVLAVSGQAVGHGTPLFALRPL